MIAVVTEALSVISKLIRCREFLRNTHLGFEDSLPRSVAPCIFVYLEAKLDDLVMYTSVILLAHLLVPDTCKGFPVTRSVAVPGIPSGMCKRVQGFAGRKRVPSLG